MTALAGSYILTLRNTASGIVDSANNLLAAAVVARWTTDLGVPTATVVAVTPDPRTTPVDSVIFNFNEAVTGVDLSDFSLFLDGVAVDLTGATVTAVSATQYRLNLTTVTAANGSYTLTLNAAGSEIRDAAGNLFATSVTDRWVKTAPPSAARTASGTLSTIATSSASPTTVSSNAPTNITLSNLTVSENAAGAVIGTLAVIDAKKGTTHILTVSDSRFEVVGSRLKLKNGISLDFEAAKTVAIDVTATDKSDTSRRLTRRFTINIKDIAEPQQTKTSVAMARTSPPNSLTEAEQLSLIDSLFADFQRTV